MPYVDVCDDHEYTESTKALHHKAVDAGVPCITSAGIYPGRHWSLHLLSVLQAQAAPESRGVERHRALLRGMALIGVLHNVQSMDTNTAFICPVGTRRCSYG